MKKDADKYRYPRYAKRAFVFSLLTTAGTMEFTPFYKAQIQWMESRGIARVDWQKQKATFLG